MESVDGVNTTLKKVVDLKEFKRKKRSQKHLYLYIDEHYEHTSLPIALKVLALSTPNPFTSNKVYLCVDQYGSMMCFEEGEEALWNPISDNQFKEFVDEAIEKAQGTKLEEEIQKS
tara:strand:+ start:255 stop:602 length:348 start_codon:yes stop_codon:yes gene_type:complete